MTPPPTPANPNDDLTQLLERLRATGSSIPQLFTQSLRLLDEGAAEGRDRAAALLGDMLRLQVTDENARDFGQMPMRPGSTAGDLNNALFVMPDLVDILGRHAARLPAGLAQRLDQAARRALAATRRRWDEEIFDLHRDHAGYTNIFTKLYDQDWRTLPLLACPEQTLAPGELAARAIRTLGK